MSKLKEVKIEKKYNGLQSNIEQFSSDDKYNNNCYTYAINQPLNPYTKEPYEIWDYCQPGYLGGKWVGSHIFPDFPNLIELVKADLNEIGYDIRESTYEEYIDDKDAWKVALCRREDNHWDPDYHWYRQNLDGTWSHKLGWDSVKNMDESSQEIKNPEECDRGSYKIFMGFYMVYPSKAAENNENETGTAEIEVA
jgi:hypothetical protein